METSPAGPPIVPPQITAVGASPGDPDDRAREAYRNIASLLSGNWAPVATGEYTGPDLATKLLEKAGFSLAQGVEAALPVLELLDPTERETLREALAIRRNLLREQIDLEQLVRRPPKKGHLPHWADDEAVTRQEEAIQALDWLIAKLTDQ